MANFLSLVLLPRFPSQQCKCSAIKHRVCCQLPIRRWLVDDTCQAPGTGAANSTHSNDAGHCAGWRLLQNAQSGAISMPQLNTARQSKKESFQLPSRGCCQPPVLASARRMKEARAHSVHACSSQQQPAAARPPAQCNLSGACQVALLQSSPPLSDSRAAPSFATSASDSD